MNDPSAQPIDIAEQRAWLIDHRTATGFSWSKLAERIGIPAGTLSQFGGKNGYNGDETRLAEAVFRYRQDIQRQANLTVDLPEVPGYFETQTSRELTMLLSWAKRGRIVCAATGAGLGKSETARHFQACFPNVFHVTMSPSTAGVNNMQVALLEAMGEKMPRGTPQALSRRICELAKSVHLPLVIIDEAQHLSVKALDEIRSWNDKVGLGIALFGNVPILKRIEGLGRDESFAQLYSRLSMRMIRPLPLRADAIAQAEAWGIQEEALVNLIVRIAQTPGGLRNSTFVLEIAAMLAAGENRAMELDDLQSAWSQLSTRGGLA